MRKEAFARLIYILHNSRRLKCTCFSTVEEQVAKFLNIIGHNWKLFYKIKLLAIEGNSEQTLS